MTQEEAISLIRTSHVSHDSPSNWADLGCGNGTFTMALASLLAKGSKIYAVDQNAASLKAIPQIADIAVEKIQADFTLDNWQSDPMDGILMANSLHFVKDKKSLLKKLSSRLKPSGIFLVVEYDMNKSSPWVPYPLPFESMKNIFSEILGRSVERLGEMSSRYNRAKIYAAVAS